MVYDWKEDQDLLGRWRSAKANLSARSRGDTKAHEDALLRMLLALHRYCSIEEHLLDRGRSTHLRRDEAAAQHRVRHRA